MSDWKQETSDWLVEETLRGTRADRVMKHFCEALSANGISLVRGHIASGQLHPLFRAFSVSWNRDSGIIRDRFSYEGTTTEAWEQSPLKAVLSSDMPEIRARLHFGEGLNQYPVFKDFKSGGTPTICAFARRSLRRSRKPLRERMDGCIASFASDAAGGFSDNCIDTIKRLFPRLAVAIKTIVREGTAQNLASTYLGSQAGERVLRGRIRRGDMEDIVAAVWYSDMRNSTPLADTLPPQVFLNRLNRYFEATAGSILDHGGEVLRFIGDAVLAIFPISGPGGAERAGRMAVSSARAAVARMAELNENTARGRPNPHRIWIGPACRRSPVR
jgi:adenylate cyclase